VARCWYAVSAVEPAAPASARSFDKAAARLAFRRRSISEDTYSRGDGQVVDGPCVEGYCVGCPRIKGRWPAGEQRHDWCEQFA